jgi:hypothetical protein
VLERLSDKSDPKRRIKMAHAKLGKFFVANVNSLNKGEFVRFESHSDYMSQVRSDYVLIEDARDNGPILAKIDQIYLLKDDDGQLLGLELWVEVI